MAFDYRRLSRRARHLMRRLKRTKHASVQQVTVHELNNEIHRRRFGRVARTAEPSAARLGHWRPLTRRAKKLLTQLGRAKVWVVQRRLVKELVAEMEHGRRFLAARMHKAKRRLTRAVRSRRSWHATGHTWQSARQPGSRERQFSATRAGRRWGRQNARREVPGYFQRFAARRGWTRLQEGHGFTPAARAAEDRAQRRVESRTVRASTPSRPVTPSPRGRLAPGSSRPAPARTVRPRS